MASIQSIAGGIVALLLVVIMVGVVATPVITDIANGSPFEGENGEPGTRFAYVEASKMTTAITAVSASSSPYLTVAGEEWTSTSPFGGYRLSIITDKFMVRTSSFQVFIDFTTNEATNVTGSGNSLTITIQPGGAYTVVTNSNETIASGTISWVLYPSSTGEWGRYTSGAMVSPGQKAIVAYAATTRTDTTGWTVCSTVVNGQTTNLCNPFDETTGDLAPAGTTSTANVEVVGDMQIVYKVTGLTQTWGTDPTVFSNNITYAPISYSSGAAGEGLSGMQHTLVMLVPTLLAIVAVVVGARMIAARE